jgi:polysaccharide biosynthesis transport protein
MSQFPQNTQAPDPTQDNPAGSDPTIQEPVGNIRRFIDEPGPAPINPVALVMRALKGRAVAALVIGSLVGACLAIAVYLVLKPAYKASGIIRVSPTTSKILYQNDDNQLVPLYDAFINAQVLYLRSRPVLERALASKELGNHGTQDTEARLAVMAASIEVQREPKSEVVAVTCKSSDPALAAGTVNAIFDAYEAIYGERAERKLSVRETTLAARQTQLTEKLRQITQRMIVTGEEHGFESIEKAHLQMLAHLDAMNKRVADMDASIAQQQSATGSHASGDSGDGEITRLTVLDHAMADLLFERSKRAASLGTLQSRYQSSYPRLVEARAELKVIDDAIEARRSQLSTLGKTGVLTQSNQAKEDNSVDHLKQVRAQLSQDRDHVKAQAVALNQKRLALSGLTEERNETRKMLEETSQGLEEIRLEARTSLPGRIEIAARAGVPTAPANDRRLPIAAISAVAGLLATLAVPVICVLLWPRIRTSTDVASIPAIASGLLAVLPRQSDDLQHVSTAYTREARRLRNRLTSLLDVPSRSRIFVVTGAGSQKSRPAAAFHLAHAVADTGARTLLVDADLIESQLTALLKLQDHPGLRQALLASDAPLHPTHIYPSLHVLPIGMGVTPEDGTLGQEIILQTLLKLRSSYETIIIDAGPIDQRLAAPLILTGCDYAVITAATGQPESTLKSSFRHAQELTSRRVCVALLDADSDDPGISQAPAQESRFGIKLASKLLGWR